MDEKVQLIFAGFVAFPAMYFLLKFLSRAYEDLYWEKRNMQRLLCGVKKYGWKYEGEIKKQIDEALEGFYE